MHLDLLDAELWSKVYLPVTRAIETKGIIKAMFYSNTFILGS